MSNGAYDPAEYGHTDAYLNNEHDVQEAIDHETCELCLPNFMALIDADIARGLIRRIRRYEWVGE